jgi:hypothetical protein
MEGTDDQNGGFLVRKKNCKNTVDRKVDWKMAERPVAEDCRWIDIRNLDRAHERNGLLS